MKIFERLFLRWKHLRSPDAETISVTCVYCDEQLTASADDLPYVVDAHLKTIAHKANRIWKDQP